MPHLLWDASGLAKRYTQETGSDTVQALFKGVDRKQIVTTIWGYAETFSILLRRYNGGAIRKASFVKATSALRTEIIEDPNVGVLTIDDAAILAGISLMQKHNLNSTDAAVLTMFLRYVHWPGVPACVLITADKRLVRASSLEGLPVLNPEVFPAADVSSFLASL